MPSNEELDAAVERFTRTSGDGDWKRETNWSKSPYSAYFTDGKNSVAVEVGYADDGDIVVVATD